MNPLSLIAICDQQGPLTLGTLLLAHPPPHPVTLLEHCVVEG